jgi:hypothetical protein
MKMASPFGIVGKFSLRVDMGLREEMAWSYSSYFAPLDPRPGWRFAMRGEGATCKGKPLITPFPLQLATRTCRIYQSELLPSPDVCRARYSTATHMFHLTCLPADFPRRRCHAQTGHQHHRTFPKLVDAFGLFPI